MDYNNKNISTTKPFSQQEHFHSKTIFTAINKTTFTNKTIFTTRKHKTRTAVAVLPVGVSAVGTPGTSGNVRSVTASLIGPHPAALCARIAYLESQRNQKTVLVLIVHASKISQTEQNITQQARMFA